MSKQINPYRNARTITPGTDVKPGVSVYIGCSEAGVVQLKLVDGGVLPVRVYVGSNLLEDFAVIGVVEAGTTATATVSVLDRSQ